MRIEEEPLLLPEDNGCEKEDDRGDCEVFDPLVEELEPGIAVVEPNVVYLSELIGAYGDEYDRYYGTPCKVLGLGEILNTRPPGKILERMRTAHE